MKINQNERGLVSIQSGIFQVADLYTDVVVPLDTVKADKCKIDAWVMNQAGEELAEACRVWVNANFIYIGNGGTELVYRAGNSLRNIDGTAQIVDYLMWEVTEYA